jgi:hypothetical protein
MRKINAAPNRLQGETAMSENNEPHAAEDAPPATNGADNGHTPSDIPRINRFAPRGIEFIAGLKRHAEQSRLSPELLAEIVAGMLPWEEQERLYREMQENGGLSGEEFFASLGIDMEEQL